MSDAAESPPVTPPPIEPKPQRLAPWRKVLVALIFIVLIAALVIGVMRLARGGDSATTASNPSLPTSVPTTGVAREEPPALSNTVAGDNIDWDRMVRSIHTYQQWLYEHRRPELLANIVREDNPSYQNTLLGLTNLAGHPDWHYDPVPPPIDVRSVRLDSRPAPDRALVVVQTGPIPATRVIDAAGRTVYEEPSHPAQVTLWNLSRDAGSTRWRVARIDPQ